MCSPAANDSPGEAAETALCFSRVFSKRTTATASEPSWISVPKISPAEEQPMKWAFGYAAVSSWMAAELARNSEAPKTTTSVPSESSSGNLGTLHPCPCRNANVSSFMLPPQFCESL